MTEKSNGEKKIETLVQDIEGLFLSPHQCQEPNLDWFAEQLKILLRRRFSEIRGERTLRMSNLGRGDRAVWYDIKGTHTKEEMPPHQYIKFLYGDLIELLLLFLVREAGHRIENEQKKVVVDGVVGHTDGIIDGHTVDCKSASSYGFKKFKDETIYNDDAFGYIAQISGYNEGQGLSDRSAYFLVLDKTLGHLCLMEVPPMMQINVKDRIMRMKAVIASDAPPERCYDPIPEGKSGNLKLGVACSYCAHKFECWKDMNGGKGLRQFIYSTGPVWLTGVEKEPRVMEVKGE